ncbi:MAG: type II secretion system protein [Pedobacter sp.]|jgi:prepilin-type N-terminal cleavage/methylation domain-containing protein
MTSKKQNGFTLVEALIAVAVFAIFSLLVNSIFFNILRGTAKQEALREVKQNGDFAMTLMANNIRYATGIYNNQNEGVLATNCTEVDGTSLKVLNADGTTTKYELTGSSGKQKIQMTTSGSSEFITGSQVELQDAGDLYFECIQYDPSFITRTITITFLLEHINNNIYTGTTKRPENQAVMYFQTTVYMRGN